MEEQINETYGLLSKLFVYKAEWLENDMFKLYTQPNYFPEITGIESCVLIGGRGTGKTTVLKGLSYTGQYAQDNTSIEKINYYGLYYKVESNRISAFTGLGKNDDEWIRAFSHYINLIIISLAVDMIIWMEEKEYIEKDIIEEKSWRLFENSMQWDRIKDISDLKYKVHNEISNFEIFINNSRELDYKFTILGGPVDSLLTSISEIPLFKEKKFFILIDEYENLSKYQQEVVNTLIKQASGKNYSFKISVRELGWKSRKTLNFQELRSPSDYRKIEIQNELEESFDSFATSVCEGRLKILYEELGLTTEPVMKNLFPSLTMEEEADILGVKQIIESSERYKLTAKQLPKLHPLYVWFIGKWGEKNESINVTIKDYKLNRKKWDERFENYKYSLLFSIKDRKVGIRKFYSGWNTLMMMSGANIRFMLQLVEACLKTHLKEGGKIGQPVNAINQTRGAYKVGYSNFDELEGLDVNGDSIMQLIQGLGRAFEVLARQPFGHAPEVNQFWVSDMDLLQANPDEKDKLSVQFLLDASVSHLALKRTISTKLAMDAPKSFDYCIHPIYSALFRISHRRKRKLTLSKAIIEELVVNQRNAIDYIIKKNNRIEDDLQISENKIEQQKDSPKNKNNNDMGTQLELF